MIKMSRRFILCVYVGLLARCEATSPTTSTVTTQQFHQARHIRHVQVGGMLLHVLESADLVSTALYVYGSYVGSADGFRVSLKKQPVEDPLSASRCASQTGSVKCQTGSVCTRVRGPQISYCYYDAVFTRFPLCSFHETSRECQCTSWVSRTEQRQACRSCSDLSLDCENILDQGFATGQSIPMTTQWTERIQTSYEAIELWIAASISFAATVV